MDYWTHCEMEEAKLHESPDYNKPDFSKQTFPTSLNALVLLGYPFPLSFPYFWNVLKE